MRPIILMHRRSHKLSTRFAQVARDFVHTLCTVSFWHTITATLLQSTEGQACDPNDIITVSLNNMV